MAIGGGVPPKSPARGGKSTSVSTMTRSSTTSQPTAIRPFGVSIWLRSCSARSSTTVLATDSDRPKTSPAPMLQPSVQASPAPMRLATVIWPTAPGMAMVRTDNRSFNENAGQRRTSRG